MEVKVLGACCKKATDTFANAKQAIKQMGLDLEVINIGDPVEITQYGVMMTPALVIDDQVVAYGKLLKVKEIIALIQAKQKV